MTSCEVLMSFSVGLFSIQSLPSHSPLGCTGRAARRSAGRRRASHAVRCPPRAALRGGQVDSRSRSGTCGAPGDEPRHAPCVQYDSLGASATPRCQLDKFTQRVRLLSAIPEDDFNVRVRQNGRRALWCGWIAALAGRQNKVFWLPLPVRHIFSSGLRPQTRRRLTFTVLVASLEHAQRLMLRPRYSVLWHGWGLHSTAFPQCKCIRGWSVLISVIFETNLSGQVSLLRNLLSKPRHPSYPCIFCGMGCSNDSRAIELDKRPATYSNRVGD